MHQRKQPLDVARGRKANEPTEAANRLARELQNQAPQSSPEIP